MSSLSQLFPSSGGGGGGSGSIKRVEYLLVGGGGASAGGAPPLANSQNGGGGAGRVVHSNEEFAIIGITTWTINVGYGGNATDNPIFPTPTPNINNPVHNGTPSSITNQDSVVIATANGGGTAGPNGSGPTIGSAGANNAPSGAINTVPASVTRTSSTVTGEFVFYYDLGNPSGLPNAPAGPFNAGGGGGATEGGQFYDLGGTPSLQASFATPTGPYDDSIGFSKGGRGYYSEITGTGVTYGQGGDGGSSVTPTNPGVTQPFNTGWGASGGGPTVPSAEFYGGSPGVCVVRWRSPLGDAASVTGNDPTLPSTVNPGWYTYRFTTTSTSAGIGTISF